MKFTYYADWNTVSIKDPEDFAGKVAAIGALATWLVCSFILTPLSFIRIGWVNLPPTEHSLSTLDKLQVVYTTFTGHVVIYAALELITIGILAYMIIYIIVEFIAEAFAEPQSEPLLQQS